MKRYPEHIQFGGYRYRRVVGSFDDAIQEIGGRLDNAVMAFDDFMQQLQEKGPSALPLLNDVFDQAYSAAKACQRVFRMVLPEKVQAATVRYKGRVYTAVAHPYESLQATDAAREFAVSMSHLDSIVMDAQKVAEAAQQLIDSLSVLGAQAGGALSKNPDKLDSSEVSALNPMTRVDDFKDPLRTMDKANRSLNYTVDAAQTAIKVVLDQIDAMVDEWHARVDQMNAPHPSEELTKPMLMSDNPAAVFDELGGL